MEATKPPKVSEAKHTAEQARGDTWTASQLRLSTSSEITRGGVKPDLFGQGDSTQTVQGWAIAGLALASIYVLFGIEMLVDDPVWATLAWKVLPFVSAALLVVGIAVRGRFFYLGTTLIVLGCPIAFFGYWMMFPPALAIIVILGAIQRKPVINKRVLFWTLLMFVTAIYVGLAVGVGTFVSSRAERDIWIPIAVTAVVAVLFQPIRVRLQGFANRLVYGKRATPYEVLAHFADRVAGT